VDANILSVGVANVLGGALTRHLESELMFQRDRIFMRENSKAVDTLATYSHRNSFEDVNMALEYHMGVPCFRGVLLS
jgi:hypothetical protein